MVWTIEFDPVARKEFNKLGTTTQRYIRDYLETLKTVPDPRMRGKPLKGNKAGFWRYRVDKYRIICRIEENRLVIFIIRIGKRDKVYD